MRLESTTQLALDRGVSSSSCKLARKSTESFEFSTRLLHRKSTNRTKAATFESVQLKSFHPQYSFCDASTRHHDDATRPAPLWAHEKSQVSRPGSFSDLARR